MKKSKVTLEDLTNNFNLHVECGSKFLSRQVEGGYVGDLLSDVMANSKKGDVWITLQVHPNIVAVAVLKELVGIVLVNGRKPEPETIKKAVEEKLPVLSTDLSAFELVGKLYGTGISGSRK